MKKNCRVIFDTNVWISFLIGKKLSSIKRHISNGDIQIITTTQLLREIKEVTSREKLKKYFPQKSVLELIELLETIGNHYDIEPKYLLCRDEKDNFLLNLIDSAKADYLVTGDKDLLDLNHSYRRKSLHHQILRKFLIKFFTKIQSPFLKRFRATLLTGYF